MAAALDRGFLVVWSGQALSAVGSTLSGVGVGVWVFLETGSAAWLGALSAVSATAPVVLMPLLRRIDSWPLRRVMIGGDLVAAIAAAAMLALAISDRIEVWHLCVGAFVGGGGEAFRQPAFVAAIPHLVDEDSLDRANGLNQFGPALGISLGPILAGPMVSWWGLEAVLIADLVTFAIAVVTTLAVRFGQRAAATSDDGSWVVVRRWLLGPGRRLAMLVALMATVNLIMAAFSIAVLALAVEVAGAELAGLPLALGGVAMVLSSLAVGALGLSDQRIRAVVAGLALLGVGCWVAASRPSLPLVAVGLIVAMAAVPAASAAVATIFHEQIPEEFRGRVFALSGAAATALGPVGSLGAGILISAVAVPAMAADGWAGRSIGSIIGTGAERGPALLLIASGVALAAMALVTAKLGGRLDPPP